MRKLMNRKGFTLVEILVVILIIGILFVAFLPRIDFAGDKARETNVKTDLRTFMVASEQLFKEQAGLPMREVDTAASLEEEVDNAEQFNLLLDPANKVTFDTDALISAQTDPWEEEYQVNFYSNYPTTNKQAILITSHGKDYVDTEDTADYGAVVIYDKGFVSSCTFGLNQNIGEFLNDGSTEATTGFSVATFAISTAVCQ